MTGRDAETVAYRETFTLTHGEQLYTDLLDRIRRDDELVAAMWTDAECRPDELDVPGTHWTVTVAYDGTPTAWAAARITDDVLQCHSNYEVRAWRGNRMYEAAYHARHWHVVHAYGLPAVTYLFAEPIGLHEADLWRRTGQTGVGETGHQWWELRRSTKKPGIRT